MKLTKKVLSIMLALILCVSTFSFSIPAIAGSTSPYIKDGKFYRMNNGVYLSYETSYNDVVSAVRNALLAHKTSVSVRYAVLSTNTKYGFDYDYEPDKNAPQAEKDEYKKQLENKDNKCKQFITDVFYSCFGTVDGNPLSGDYSYHNLVLHSLDGKANFEFSFLSLPNEKDYVNGKKYTNIQIEFTHLNYYTTTAQDKAVLNTVNNLSENVLNIKSKSDYQKVKTIYDFIVRNTTYDEFVRSTSDKNIGKTGYASLTRYKKSHSAYGALFGDYSSTEIDLSVKNSVTNQKVLKKYDQGRAVCEGYSKLFYVFCMANGIPCRIVDGDYTSTSKKESDPHQWNVVYLYDNVSKTYKWYSVDTTFASMRSLKAVDYNSYDYFLRGTAGGFFKDTAHQQPYKFTTQTLGQENNTIHQLYNWYSTANKASTTDYPYDEPKYRELVNDDTNFIVCRSYTFNGEDRGSYLLTGTNSQTIIVIDEKGKIKSTKTGGFNYNGLNCEYTITVPYVVKGVINVPKATADNMVNVGKYTYSLSGQNGTTVKVPLSIQALDMSNSSSNVTNTNYSPEGTSVDKYAYYNGSTIVPKTKIVDGFGNVLTNPTDYVVNVYSDSAHTKKTTISKMGKYYVDIAYKGNYKGHYYITFEVRRINIANLKISDVQSYMYMPKGARAKSGVSTINDYIKYVAPSLKIGTETIVQGTDYKISASGTLAYGSKGTVTMTSCDTPLVLPNKVKKYSYVISKRYDISSLSGTFADSSKNIAYTGKAVTPTKFANLDTILEPGVDYKIVGYSNNVNPSTSSSPAYVTIQGINGCTGTAKLKFVITDKRTSITKTYVAGSVKVSNNTVTYQLTANGKSTGTKLVKGKDYTEKAIVKNGTPAIQLTGIGNYKDIFDINLTGFASPSASGNTVQIPYTATTYTGKAIEPTVAVSNSAKKLLITNFYTCTYSNNTNVGTAKVVVKFSTGAPSITKTFKINPKGTALGTLTPASKAIKVTWTKQATQTTGYQIQYSTSSSFSSPKTVTVASNSTVSKTISSLTSNKTYYVRIRTYKTVGSTNYYSAWSSAKSAKVK